MRSASAADDGHTVRPQEKTESSTLLTAASVQAQLERILASEAFSHSERLRRFLRFIVEQTNEGHGGLLKEYQIGLAVFDRRESFDSRLDPIVRVEARRLRSKLKEFYSTEGSKDPLIIELPKGSYVPVFQERVSGGLEGGRTEKWIGRLYRWPTAAAVIALAVTCALLYWGLSLHRENVLLRSKLQTASSQSIGPEFAPVWGQILSPDAQNFIVFGSPVFFSVGGTRLFLRSVDINSPEDLVNNPLFLKLQKRFGRLSAPRYDYALTGDALALQRLGSFLGRAGVKVNALEARVATWDMLKDGNVIFLGPPRMDALLQNLPVQQHFVWKGDTLLNRVPQPGEQAAYESPSHRDSFSYAVISRLPGLRKNRQLLLLTSHSAPGTLAAVESVTRSQSIIEINEKLGLDKAGPETYYQVMLKVFVDQGNLVRSEYVIHHILSSAKE